ncbi:MAG: transposase [Phycisphaerales bacterium]|jgi:REP element-mobilizing transposase RayT
MRSDAAAYFITFRCYGTWLHGDERGSVNRKMPRGFGDPFIPPTQELEAMRGRALQHAPVVLSGEARETVEGSIRGVCKYREWRLHALAARTNHVHIVVSASDRPPELVMNSFKSWTTRGLVEAGHFAKGHRIWSRHGSTIYLWNAESIAEKVEYVVNGQ